MWFFNKNSNFDFKLTMDFKVFFLNMNPCEQKENDCLMVWLWLSIIKTDWLITNFHQLDLKQIASQLTIDF